MLTAAGVLIASVVGFGVINSAGFQRWYSAFIVGREDYWQPYRQSLMEVYVVAQPGTASGSSIGPRLQASQGADLTLVAQSPEGKRFRSGRPSATALRNRRDLPRIGHDDPHRGPGVPPVSSAA